MNQQAIEKVELNKILSTVAEFAVLDGAKARLKLIAPTSSLKETKSRLQTTTECISLLFTYGVPKIEYFSPFEDELSKAEKRATLSCGELLKVGGLLRSTRITYTGLQSINDGEIQNMRALADKLYYDTALEDDIHTKIINDSEVSDYASEKLYSIRREIRLLNERIRARLSAYLTGKEGKYLQDAIVTMRDNRYVLPVRAEYKRNVKGFIHDKSQSGATFFIEPEEVLEMNNELRSLTIDEKEEVERILHELSVRVGALSTQLNTDILILEEIDMAYARAEYGYKLSCVCPEMNDVGVIDIQQGRHPLIDRKKVVPVSLKLGNTYRFLLISGPNTGGKTVTLKMTGLFCLMAMCGLFVPAKRAVLSVFEEIYCDVGDLQSIEENLSTFSSHITNIIHIVNHATKKCLVLIDELGGGTDPEEGQALAKAIVEHLLKTGCVGVVTTHYTALKEFAFSCEGIENASMEFDANTLQPLYVMKIGLPGSSNALGISRRLGLKEEILQCALDNLSVGARNFENIVRSAEESRVLAEKTLNETNALKTEWQEKIKEVNQEKESLKKEREKLFTQAKAQSRKIITERTAEAEEILEEIEEIFKKESISQADLIYARTLKNKLRDKAFDVEQEEIIRPQYKKAKESDMKLGAKVYVTTLSQEGIIQNVRAQKKEVEVLCGNLRVRSKFDDIAIVINEIEDKSLIKTGKNSKQKTKTETVQVKKSLLPKLSPGLEVNVIGHTVADAIIDVGALLDGAVISNLEEVRIIHGMGTGKLRAGIHEYLRTHPNVAEFRLGKYGEGDTGVTIVKIK